MIRYEFKDRPLTIKGAATANAQKIGEALVRVKEVAGAKCSSKAALAVITKDKTNYLRRHLEWDDKACGLKYRQTQVMELMSCINIVSVDAKGRETSRLPAFISLAEKGGRRYRTLKEVMDSAALSAIALKQAEAEMLAMENRLAQFGEICNAIKKVRAMISARRQQYQADGGEQHVA